MILSSAVNEYVVMLRKTGEKSANTIRAQSSDLKHLSEYYGTKKVIEISGTDIGHFNDTLRHEHRYASTSLVRLWSTMVSFFNFCEARDIIEKNPLSEMKPPVKAEVPPPTLLTKAETRKILNAPLKEQKRLVREFEKRKKSGLPTTKVEERLFDSCRNRALVELMFATGMRPGEIVKLEKKDFDFTGFTVVIKNRKGEERIGYYPLEDVRRALNEYNSSAEQMFHTGDDRAYNHEPRYFFVHWNDKPLSEDSVRQIVHRCALAAGIKKTVTPYTLRHTIAAFLRASGINIHAIRQLIGTSSSPK